MAVCNNLDCSQVLILPVRTAVLVSYVPIGRASGFKAVYGEGLTSSTGQPSHSKPVSALEATVTKGLRISQFLVGVD